VGADENICILCVVAHHVWVCVWCGHMWRETISWESLRKMHNGCMYVVEVGECGGAGGVAFSIAGAVLNGRRG
jgi:hypothetical protein